MDQKISEATKIIGGPSREELLLALWLGHEKKSILLTVITTNAAVTNEKWQYSFYVNSLKRIDKEGDVWEMKLFDPHLIEAGFSDAEDYYHTATYNTKTRKGSYVVHHPED